MERESVKREQMEAQLREEHVRSSQLESELADARAERERLQTELSQVRGVLANRTVRVEELDRVLASRSWRWTRLLRFLARVWRNKGISVADRHQVARMIRARTPAPLKTALPVVAAQRPGVRDYFVWAVIDWHYRMQRPQHLSVGLARLGHRVFYVSNEFVDRKNPGIHVEPLDETGRLFQVNLNLESSPAIYHAPPDVRAREQLREGVGLLLEWTRTRGAVSVVDHPYWLEIARLVPDSRLVYDCMDHHDGFADNTSEALSRERELMQKADLLVVTSVWLEQASTRYNRQIAVIRNACEYEHFASAPREQFRDPQGRKIVGYYGAIAEWFDLDLVEKVARKFADCLILLVGMDVAGAAHRCLGGFPNVKLVGEVPYDDLPYYLYAFSVCMLPFKIIPLTLATNPVKVYEYLCAGCHVVSVDLPELHQFGGLVKVAADHDAFLEAVAESLAFGADEKRTNARRQFAAKQTWNHRVRDLDTRVRDLRDPRVSVVVVTYNNLALTKDCLHSLDVYSDYSNLELIVVDNASADGTPDFLREWTSQGPERHVILNTDNRGFAAANNQGLAVATGEYLVMLNNDTYVTPGWVATLVGHQRRHPDLGMLGPVTNNIGNEARIQIAYANMDEMLNVSRSYTRRHVGQLTPLRTAAFFCVMMPRHVYEKVGNLDEAFGIGMFEDDDYCRRIEQEGWSIACAEDVFIHHHLSASFSKIKQEIRQEMFEKNKQIYEAKWGPWIPHRYREGM